MRRPMNKTSATAIAIAAIIVVLVASIVLVDATDNPAFGVAGVFTEMVLMLLGTGWISGYEQGDRP